MNKKKIVGEISYVVKNTISCLQEIHNDYSLSRVCVSLACSLTEDICLWMLTVIFVFLFAQGNNVNIPWSMLSRGQGSSDGRLSSFRSSVQTVIIRAE